MGAIIIVYEKYSLDQYDYSRSMLPIIISLSVLLFCILFTLFSLGVDLLDKGCLAWHRDSLGYFLQAVIANICILVTTINLKNYIEQFEIDEDIIESKYYPILSNLANHSSPRLEHGVMPCFVPILILSSLWLIKILCFKVKNSIMHIAILISMASTAFAFESYFDNELENVPLYIVAIPISCILLAISFFDLIEIYFETDECLIVFNSFDSSLKRCLGIFNCVVTFIFVVSSILALYCLEQAYTNHSEDKAIIHWGLFSSIIYLVFMMPHFGSLILDIICSQFATEMIK